MRQNTQDEKKKTISEPTQDSSSDDDSQKGSDSDLETEEVAPEVSLKWKETEEKIFKSKNELLK
jgi:hypothetical protein